MACARVQAIQVLMCMTQPARLPSAYASHLCICQAVHQNMLLKFPRDPNLSTPLLIWLPQNKNVPRTIMNTWLTNMLTCYVSRIWLVSYEASNVMKQHETQQEVT